VELENLSELVKNLEKRLVQIQDRPPPSYEHTTDSTQTNFASLSLAILNQIGSSISNIEPKTTNQHFETPKPIDFFYTGREEQAEKLKSWLLPEPSQAHGKTMTKDDAKQKRFVVYGVGGAGKTQFCCKFAEDNKER
jgi:hypothetical protein